MDNLSNALFLLEASDSFISFANFFCANPTLYPKVCSFDVWTRENGGNCYITYCKSQQQKYFFKKFTNNRLEKTQNEIRTIALSLRNIVSSPKKRSTVPNCVNDAKK